MAMNIIQFQADLSLHEFLRRYDMEEQYESALFASRWPRGWQCSRCDGTHYCCTHNGCKLWECLDCGYQSSSIAGTVFKYTKLPLTIWFLAIYLMTQSKNPANTLEFKCQLGVSYKTAWSTKHKLLQTMLLREEQRCLVSTAHGVSDGLWCFGAVTHSAAQHQRHVTGGGKLAVQRPDFHWVNILLGNLKTKFSGIYHVFNHAPYAHRYLAEFSSPSILRVSEASN